MPDAEIGSGPLTVDDVVSFVAGTGWHAIRPHWPPDVFGIAAAVLEVSGRYVDVVRPGLPSGWAEDIDRIAAAWKFDSDDPGCIPVQVQDAWTELVDTRSREVQSLRNDRDAIANLLRLLAASDEACRDFLSPMSPRGKALGFQLTKNQFRSLSRHIDPSRARVIPKSHAPQVGLSIQSLSRYVGLYFAEDTDAHFYTATQRGDADRGLRILVVPWPFELDASAFVPSRPDQHNMPSPFGMLEIRRDPRPDELLETVKSLLDAVPQPSEAIDLLVFPELALFDDECRALHKLTQKKRITLVAGVHHKSRSLARSVNTAAILHDDWAEPVRQHKHHRWKIDSAQIHSYGLRLDTRRVWWEDTPVERRVCNVFQLRDDLTFSVLVCEDLARQHPVMPFLRAAGPNLIVTLLMDGPQHAARWSSRYAASLVDDPGSSVLSLTSMGMCLLDRRRQDEQVSIGAWTDWKGRTEIQIGPRDKGAFLELEATDTDEWTADGRRSRARRLTLDHSRACPYITLR